MRPGRTFRTLIVSAAAFMYAAPSTTASALLERGPMQRRAVVKPPRQGVFPQIGAK